MSGGYTYKVYSDPDIPDILREWLLEIYGEGFLDEFIRLRSDTIYKQPHINWEFGDYPRLWIAEAFDWGLSKYQSFNLSHWYQISREWEKYIETL